MNSGASDWVGSAAATAAVAASLFVEAESSAISRSCSQKRGLRVLHLQFRTPGRSPPSRSRIPDVLVQVGQRVVEAAHVVGRIQLELHETLVIQVDTQTGVGGGVVLGFKRIVRVGDAKSWDDSQVERNDGATRFAGTRTVPMVDASTGEDWFSILLAEFMSWEKS